MKKSRRQRQPGPVTSARAIAFEDLHLEMAREALEELVDPIERVLMRARNELPLSNETALLLRRLGDVVRGAAVSESSPTRLCAAVALAEELIATAQYEPDRVNIATAAQKMSGLLSERVTGEWLQDSLGQRGGGRRLVAYALADARSLRTRKPDNVRSERERAQAEVKNAMKRASRRLRGS